MHCERFVQLPQADILHLEAEAPKQLGDRENGADAHFVGLGACGGHADIAAQRGKALGCGNAGFHDHNGCRTIRKLAGITGSYNAAFDHRLEAAQPFELGVGAVAFVLGDGHVVHRDLASFLVLHAHGGSAGDDLCIKFTSRLSGCGALLRLQRIGIAHFAADAITRADRFGGLQHGHIDLAMHGHERVISRDSHFLGLNQADRILTASGDHVHMIDDHLFGGGGDGHHAR